MGTKRLTPEVKAQAAAMLEAGHSQQATAEALGISLTSVRRIRDTVTLGSKKEEFEEAARESLYAVLESDFAKLQLCTLITDDLALAKRLRSNLAQLLDDLEKVPAKDLKSIGMKARALSQVATANKLSTDSLRQVLGLGDDGNDLDELPTLVVREMLDSEITELRNQQEEEAKAMGTKVVKK